MAPGHPDPTMQEMLFVTETSELTLTWEGKKLNLEEASEISGVNNVQWNSAFDKVLEALLGYADGVYMDIDPDNEPRYPETKNTRMARQLAQSRTDLTISPVEDSLKTLRMIKAPMECELIEKAGQITRLGYDRVMKFAQPGVWEYEIEAQFAAEFISHGSMGFAYNPIIASGANACILHYEQNNVQCKDGDLVLLDVGAAYAHYNADVTRTIPVNGRFSKRQKDIYNAVLKVKNLATDLLRPGISLKDYNQQIGQEMERCLVDLGLLTNQAIKEAKGKTPAYKKYFMHGTSHHLGLDVHDLSDRDEIIKEGMVLTVEPGIYVKEEGIGIRLEDDILVGEQENINLTPGIPIEIDEIESVMNS